MALYAYCSQAASNTAERQRDTSEIEDCFHRVPDDGALLDVNDITLTTFQGRDGRCSFDA